MVTIKKTVLRWEDPSPTKQAATEDKWGQVVSELLDRPGEWALIEASTRSASQSLVARINKGASPWSPRLPVDGEPGVFVARSRYDSSRGLHRVYARFVPDPLYYRSEEEK